MATSIWWGSVRLGEVGALTQRTCRKGHLLREVMDWDTVSMWRYVCLECREVTLPADEVEKIKRGLGQSFRTVFALSVTFGGG